MTVYLVGAGPGDPKLLTVRAAEVLARADVVVYDRLSVAALLDLAPPAAERVSVGKARGRQTMAQDDINALLVERGKAGQEVVRLKGGDPFVFARGGEEAQALLEAGVPFEVVPGVTSAVAAPAYAGVPVTHRGRATSFTVVTGHEDPWAATDTDWEAVARIGRTGTVVILMGVATRAAIADRLMAGGLADDTPVAAVTWGTRPDQQVVRTTLAGLGAADVSSPAVIVVGAVAGLDLSWFDDRRPLLGRRVVVTRARHQAGELVEALRAAGAEPIEAPVIDIADPADGGAALLAAAGVVRSYDWVVFTSANAVDRFCRCLPDARAFGDVRVAVVGAATGEALARLGVRADLVPDRAVGEAVVEAFPPGPGRVLLPRAAEGREVVPVGLREKGWDVDVVEAYRTVPVNPGPEALAAARVADAIVFTSPSTVRNYLAVAGADGVPPVVVAIGPVTAEAAREAGLRDVVTTGANGWSAVVGAVSEHAPSRRQSHRSSP